MGWLGDCDFETADCVGDHPVMITMAPIAKGGKWSKCCLPCYTHMFGRDITDAEKFPQKTPSATNAPR